MYSEPLPFRSLPPSLVGVSVKPRGWPVPISVKYAPAKTRRRWNKRQVFVRD